MIVRFYTKNKWANTRGYADVASEAEADQLAIKHFEYFSIAEVGWVVSTQDEMDCYNKSMKEFADGLAQCSTLD